MAKIGRQRHICLGGPCLSASGAQDEGAIFEAIKIEKITPLVASNDC